MKKEKYSAEHFNNTEEKMYTFRNRNGEVSLFCGEREIISGITPWFNTRKNPSDLLGT